MFSSISDMTDQWTVHDIYSRLWENGLGNFASVFIGELNGPPTMSHYEHKLLQIAQTSATLQQKNSNLSKIKFQKDSP